MVKRCDVSAPSTMLRMVPPRFTGEDPLGHNLSLILTRKAGEGDQTKSGGGGASPVVGNIPPSPAIYQHTRPLTHQPP